ncbi:MAG: signal peptidase II [bacterium]|nr:signal peptidase II [bacterium]
MPQSPWRPWFWAPFVLAVDFVTKRLVLDNVEVLRGRIELIGEFARLAYVRNPGSAMGLFPVGRWVLVSVSAAAAVFLVYLYATSRPRRPVRLAAMAAILGGALGNLVDRVFYDGMVVDFIDLGIGSRRFYTFNVADMGVSLGGLVLFLCLLRDDRAASAAAPGDGTGPPPGESVPGEPPPAAPTAGPAADV